MKIAIGILVGVIVIVAGIFLLSPKAPDNVNQAQISDRTETSTTTVAGETAMPAIALTNFSFVGYGPGKSHTGTFSSYNISNVQLNNEGVPTSGIITFYVNSITTDTEMLTTDLKEKKEFFESDKYPTITFSVNSIKDIGAGTFEVSGNLTVKDVTKTITFPVQAKADKTFTSEFKVDMVPFGFTAPGIVDNEVLITFSGNLF